MINENTLSVFILVGTNFGRFGRFHQNTPK